LAYGLTALIRKIKTLFCARSIKKSPLSYAIYRS
jgi:hypothetical protein